MDGGGLAYIVELSPTSQVLCRHSLPLPSPPLVLSILPLCLHPPMLHPPSPQAFLQMQPPLSPALVLSILGDSSPELSALYLEAALHMGLALPQVYLGGGAGEEGGTSVLGILVAGVSAAYSPLCALTCLRSTTTSILTGRVSAASFTLLNSHLHVRIRHYIHPCVSVCTSCRSTTMSCF